MKYITFNELEFFYNMIVEKTGGSKGIRDKSVLESALNKPFQTFDGKDLYKDIIDKIVALTYSLINNHGFIDGNKRTGISVMLFLLKVNDINIDYSQQDLINLGLGIAKGELKEDNIKHWINMKKR